VKYTTKGDEVSSGITVSTDVIGSGVTVGVTTQPLNKAVISEAAMNLRKGMALRNIDVWVIITEG
jgi:hypothetical protein